MTIQTVDEHVEETEAVFTEFSSATFTVVALFSTALAYLLSYAA